MNLSNHNIIIFPQTDLHRLPFQCSFLIEDIFGKDTYKLLNLFTKKDATAILMNYFLSFFEKTSPTVRNWHI